MKHKVKFEFENEILEFTFNKSMPDGRGGDIQLETSTFEHFMNNCNNFYLSDSVGGLKDVILDLSLCWENGKSNKWGIVSRLEFDSKMNLPEINFIKYEQSSNSEAYNIFIKFNGKFICKFTPSNNLIEQHSDWPNSSLELRLNFRSNFKKPNNVDFGNVYCVIKDFQNKNNFKTDFN